MYKYKIITKIINKKLKCKNFIPTKTCKVHFNTTVICYEYSYKKIFKWKNILSKIKII